MTLFAWRTTVLTKVVRTTDSLRESIMEASPEDLKDIQLWLKQRMDTDWIKAHNKGTLP